MSVPTAAAGWTPVELPQAVRAVFEASAAEPPQGYRHGELFALVSRDTVAIGDVRWHISLRYGDPGANGRVPSWEELVDAGHALRPGVVFGLGLPPRSWWINVHPHVLHLWELRDPHLVALWREEGRGDRPS